MRQLRPHRREPPGPVLRDETAPGFVDTILSMAAEVNAAEARIWFELEQLAAAGDVAGIQRLVERRRQLAPVDLVAALDCERRPRSA